METITQWIVEYGYFGLFSLLMLGVVGVPVPDEALLTFCGYLIHKGDFHWVPALATAYAGSACGITVSYVLGITFGVWLVRKIGRYVHITEPRLHRLHHWFERYGGVALIVGYFVPGVRHALAYTAGMSQMRYRSFALFAYSGAVLWGTTFVAAGYWAGPAWRETLAVVRRGHTVAIAIIATLLAVGAIVWVARRNRRKLRQPPGSE